MIWRDGRELRFRPGGDVADLRGERWWLDGDLAVLDATIDDKTFHAPEYPDALTRVHTALRSPGAGDFIVSLASGYEAVDWGGVSHAGGGSHGALNAGDSLGPLLFVGCGPDDPAARPQWALRDVVPVVLEHFGLA